MLPNNNQPNNIWPKTVRNRHKVLNIILEMNNIISPQLIYTIIVKQFELHFSKVIKFTS